MGNLMVSRFNGGVAKLWPKRVELLSVFIKNPDRPGLVGTIGSPVCQNNTVTDKHTLSLCGLIHFNNFPCQQLTSGP
jgi:hypothetical protein